LSITATCGPIVLTNTVFRLGSEIPAGKGRLDHLSGGRDNGYICISDRNCLAGPCDRVLRITVELWICVL
jgi:hypothetical protein